MLPLEPAGVASRRPRDLLVLTRFDDIELAPRKNWLIAGLLGEGELSAIYGAPSSGKSALAVDMAAHIAAGRPWFGREVSGGGVLYVAAERAPLVGRRLAAWRKHHGVQSAPLAVLRGQVDFRSSATSTEEIIGHARRFSAQTNVPVRLIIVDTVSRSLAGGDENSPKDMGSLVAHVSDLQEISGAAVCLVHHIPVEGSLRLRGHGALLGALDTSISVEKRGGVHVATVQKQNDGEEGAALSFALRSVEIGEGTTAPIVVDAKMPPERATQRRALSDKLRNALDAMQDLVGSSGLPLAEDGVPPGVRAVSVEAWREELYRRGTLDRKKKNPRSDFQRVREGLKARKLADERDGRIWPIQSNQSVVARVAPLEGGATRRDSGTPVAFATTCDEVATCDGGS